MQSEHKTNVITPDTPFSIGRLGKIPDKEKGPSWSNSTKFSDLQTRQFERGMPTVYAWDVPRKRILVIAANGQDGFLTTVIALEQGATVLSLTRTLDTRLLALESQNANLSYKWKADYLSNLPEYIGTFSPTHVFYFASEHGPSGTMFSTRQTLQVTDLLTLRVPEILIDYAKRLNFGLTLPLSSRLYSGYLEEGRGDVIVDLDTPPWPNDFYGQGKLHLMQISNEAREEGVYINSPILFNHGSIFSKSGYVSHAIANTIAALLTSDSRGHAVADPSAALDISDAVRVANFLFSAQEESNGLVLVSSGVTTTIADLINEQSQLVAAWIGQSVDKPTLGVKHRAPTLIAPTSPLVISKNKREENYAWLGTMALAKVFSRVSEVKTPLPTAFRDFLPLTFRNIPANFLHRLSPPELKMEPDPSPPAPLDF